MGAAGGTFLSAQEWHRPTETGGDFGFRLGPEGSTDGSGDGVGANSLKQTCPSGHCPSRTATSHCVPAQVRGCRAGLLDLRARPQQPTAMPGTIHPLPPAARGVLFLSLVTAVLPGPVELSLPNAEPCTTCCWPPAPPTRPCTPWSLFQVQEHTCPHFQNLSPRFLLIGRFPFKGKGLPTWGTCFCEASSKREASSSPPCWMETAPGCHDWAAPLPAGVPTL